MINIKDLPDDLKVTATDKIVGTNFTDNKAYNYTIGRILELAEAVAGGVTSTNNVKLIKESTPGDWLSKLNSLNPVWVIYPSDLPILHVQSASSVDRHILVYKKSSTTSISIGLGQADVLSTDFVMVRDFTADGEVNTASNLAGGDEGLVAAKNGVDLPFKSLKEGTNIGLSSDANTVTINMTGTLGEVNTGSSVATFGSDIFKTKSGVDLQFKGIAAVGASLTPGANDVTINITEKVVKTGSFILSDATENRNEIHLKNGASAAVVTLPDTMPAAFFCGIIVYGNGAVTFTTSGTATVNQSELTAKGQWATIWITNDPEDATVWNVLGDTKL